MFIIVSIRAVARNNPFYRAYYLRPRSKKRGGQRTPPSSNMALAPREQKPGRVHPRRKAARASRTAAVSGLPAISAEESAGDTIAVILPDAVTAHRMRNRYRLYSGHHCRICTRHRSDIRRHLVPILLFRIRFENIQQGNLQCMMYLNRKYSLPLLRR